MRIKKVNYHDSIDRIVIKYAENTIALKNRHLFEMLRK